MKKTLINIIVILIVVAVTFGATRQWFPKVRDNTVVDTVRVDVPYEVTKIKEVERPIRITEYKTRYDTIETVRVVKDTVFVDTDLNTFAYNARFLTNYPTAPKFLGAQYKDSHLDLTFLKTTGQTRTKTWNVGNKGWQIGLSDGQPNIRTFDQPKDRFSHYIEGGYIRNSLYWSPYLEYSAEYLIFGMGVKGTININQQPFVKAGIKYDF